MMLPCSLWSDSTWEALWALTSLMDVEQVVSASWMIWSLVILASLTGAEQAVLACKVTQTQVVLASKVSLEHVVWASRVTREQMALASLMDSFAWDSFWSSSIPSSQKALWLQASMDALVVSSSSRALLAFSQSSIASTGGVMVSGLEAMAMGEMLVGIPSRDASAISALTWDDVSTGWSSSFDFWGRGIGMTIGLGLPRVEFSDPQPDVSSITWDRRSLTSLVMLPSPSNLGGWTYGGWLSQWWRPSKEAVPFSPAPP